MIKDALDPDMPQIIRIHKVEIDRSLKKSYLLSEKEKRNKQLQGGKQRRLGKREACLGN